MLVFIAKLAVQQLAETRRLRSILLPRDVSEAMIEAFCRR